MTNSPATTIFYEACELMSAQIDALENPEPLTTEQLLEFQGRSEQIRVLCEQLDQVYRSEAEEQPLESVEVLESVA